MTATLRPLRESDLDAVIALEAELFGAQAWSRASYVEELHQPSRHYLAAVAGGELIGYGGLFIAAESQIMTIGVHPDHRRQGVATRLLAALIDAARQRRSREVWLEVRAEDDGAQALYTAAGFSAVGQRDDYYGPGGHALVMRLVLPRESAFPGG